MPEAAEANQKKNIIPLKSTSHVKARGQAGYGKPPHMHVGLDLKYLHYYLSQGVGIVGGGASWERTNI